MEHHECWCNLLTILLSTGDDRTRPAGSTLVEYVVKSDRKRGVVFSRVGIAEHNDIVDAVTVTSYWRMPFERRRIVCFVQ